MNRAERTLAWALVAVIVSLLLVGVVSHTPLRHAVQVSPMVVVLGFRLARFGWSRFAAMAMLAFWLCIMVLIWLYLLGITKVVTGTFSVAEIALTVAIGLGSAVGIGAAFLARDSSRWPTRLAVFLVAAAIQVATTWLSVQPGLEHR
ncbi:MAG TPA: hypothetical protein VFD82_20545 [Planctomycetota bacterium]|nr:hypothetical protein [Planctomycetota bacterium]